jgi:hypothetical protein
MAPHQKDEMGGACNAKIVNKTFDSVAKLKCFGRMVTSKFFTKKLMRADCIEGVFVTIQFVFHLKTWRLKVYETIFTCCFV